MVAILATKRLTGVTLRGESEESITCTKKHASNVPGQTSLGIQNGAIK